MFRSESISERVGSPSSEGRGRRATHPRRTVTLQLEGLEDRIVPAAPDLGIYVLLPGNAVVAAGISGQTASVPVQVSSLLGLVNTGTVEVDLLLNGQPVTTATANLSNGQATVQLPVPGGLLPGTYTLLEDYLLGGLLQTSSPGTLTVTGPSTGGGGGGGGGGGAGAGAGAAGQSQLQAAFEVAIDTAAILLQGDFAAEQELQIASAVFLNRSLPSDLVSDLLAHIPAAGGLAIPAIEAGIGFANSAPS